MECGYWVDDGSEQGKCKLDGGTCRENDCMQEITDYLNSDPE